MRLFNNRVPGYPMHIDIVLSGNVVDIMPQGAGRSAVAQGF